MGRRVGLPDAPFSRLGVSVVDPLGGVDHAEVVAWVRASCAAQGVPEKIADQTILRKVAVLLRPELAGLPEPNKRR